MNVRTTRILVFINDFTGNHMPGVESAIYDEYLKLSKKLKLVVLAKDLDEKKYDNITVVEVPKPSKTRFWTLRNVMNFTSSTIKVRHDFDIIFTRMIGSNVLVPAILSKLLFRKKFVMFISGAMKVLKTKENRYNRIIIKLSVILADRLCTHSKYVLDDFESHLGYKINRNKVFFTNHYVDINFFKPLDMDTKDDVIASVGRISRIKGFELLIAAIPFIIENFPNLKIKIIGPIEDEKYYKELNDSIKETHCEKYVEFVGAVARNEITTMLNSARIFVSTSKAIGVSTAIAEAMACGKPVIATGVGSIPERENSGGIIVDRDPHALAQKIIQIMQNDVVEKQMGEMARKLAQEKFSDDFFIRKLLENFQRLHNTDNR